MNFLIDALFQSFRLLISGNQETYSAIFATLKVSTYSMVVSLIIGIPLGFILGHHDFLLKKQIRTLVDTLMSLPTVLVGLLVYSLLTHRGPLGQYGLLFSLEGIAIGQAILALPIVIALTAASVESIDDKLRVTFISLGANPRQILLSTLWETRYSILSACMNAYGRVLTEVGISIIVGGNIKWHTRTITTAITLETNKGEFVMGVALGLVLLVIAGLVNYSLSFLRKR
ncbi:MAG: ABC transporter permease subunit [Desulfobacterium sp.]|nr:ABC transporter permease subunit [Desulfobacterium sp.]MBU3948299.1 ABC transporter permease [Pseudomonadota bacterium]MBU4037167.1 ABC transporter permease [Pseudomonadota bacterium]